MDRLRSCFNTWSFCKGAVSCTHELVDDGTVEGRQDCKEYGSRVKGSAGLALIDPALWYGTFITTTLQYPISLGSAGPSG